LTGAALKEIAPLLSLAGQTLWMLEATLVLTGGKADRKEKAAGRLSRVGKKLQTCRHGASRYGFVAVLAAQAHGCVDVQLHDGAPDWPRPYELSKNLHR
jgi:hypothetical protein